MVNNPLQRYFRQPKIYISLPSKGLYYEPGALQGDYNNVPIFGMNGMDEILYKTPDALFTGEATIKVIESCCPFIKDASKMPTLDVDAVVTAIRIATFGDKLEVRHVCRNCGTENEYDIDLKRFLDYFSSITYDNKIQINDIVVTLRPLNYKELSEVNIENFKLQKMVEQLNVLEDEQEKQAQLTQVYENLAELQAKLFSISIENVQVPEGVVDSKEFISEWVKNSDRELASKIKEKLEENKARWRNPPQPVKCSECGTETSLEIELDQSNFFEKS